MVSTVVSVAGEAMACWLKFDNADGVTLPPTIADQGCIDGKDFRAGTYTLFPSIDVNSNGMAAFGLWASPATAHAGACATIRDDRMDAIGTVRASDVVKEGEAPCCVDFGKPRNRWGDCAGMALDPAEERCFWVFNQHAAPNCTTFNSTGSHGPQFGCWKTAWARLCYPAIS